MKRVLWLLLLIVPLLNLSACGKRSVKLGEVSEYLTNTKPGVTMAIVEAAPGAAVYQITNETDAAIETGNENAIVIETEQNGIWYQIETDEWSTTAEALIIEAGQTREFETTWNATYGALPKGHYRIVKGFVCEDANTDHFILSAEFEIA